LTAAEVAMALVLLSGAGLLLRSFVRVLSVDLGFESAQRVVVDLDLPAADYPEAAQRAALLESVLERVRAIPGVTAAAIADALPLHRVNLTSFTITGRPAPPRGEFLTADYADITADYLDILGAPVARGRGISNADVAAGAAGDGAGPSVVVVNQAFADKYLSFGDPLRQRLMIKDRPFEVVGIAANFRELGAEDDIRPQFFRPGVSGEESLLLLRSAVPVDALTTSLRSALGAIAEPLSTARIRSMDYFIDDFLKMRRFASIVIAVFAGLALLLAMIGVHSVLANLVSARTREIGIRIALGATAAGIARLIVGQSLRPVIIGLLVGLAGSAALGRIIQSMLFGVRPYDPVTFGGSILAIALATPLAIWWPVRRATRVDCTTALREE
jgi:putative ABC transport system permease protein